MGFYQRLKDLKEDHDMTQKDVAELIGVSINHYGKYERGETDIPLEKAIILAEYYNVSLDYLAGRTNNKRKIEPFDLDFDEQRLIGQYRLLTERSKGRLDLFLEQLINRQLKKADT